MTNQQEQKLMEAAKRDMHYLRLLTACREMEPEYQRIKAGLDPEDQQKLDRYISLCEELDYRRICIAMELGAIAVK